MTIRAPHAHQACQCVSAFWQLQLGRLRRPLAVSCVRVGPFSESHHIGRAPGLGGRAIVIRAAAAHNARPGEIRYQDVNQVVERMIARLVGGALALASITALVACVSRPGPVGKPSTAAAVPTQLAGIVGYRWRIIAVQHDATTVTIPARRGGYVALTGDDHLGGYDSINPYFGTFTPTGKGYRVTEMGVGGVGVVGRPAPDMQALIDGVKAVTEQDIEVAAALSGDRLDLMAGGYHVAAIRLAPEPNPATPAPTGTGS